MTPDLRTNEHVPLFKVDAFAERAFEGNPAAVCLLTAPRDERWMQAVAREMNLSETAFLVPRGGDFDLRWFTPTVEVELCGHATLASAHVLWETGRVAAQAAARFHTASGLLTASRSGRWIEMDFPSKPVVEDAAPSGLLEALAVQARFVGRNRFDWLVELESEAEVRALAPDFALLRTVEARGVIATAPGSKEIDFVSRFFAPRAGVDEDPVTGSAHCALGPFWAERLGKRDLFARQVSARGGLVRVGVRGPRVLLGGTAVTILQGELV